MNACPYCGAPMTTAEHKCEWRLGVNDRAARVWEKVEEAYNALYDPQREWRCEEIIAAYGQEQRRAGIEAMRKANCQCYHQTTFTCSVCRQAKQLAEQEGKG